MTAQSEPLVHKYSENGITTLTLNQPDKKNSLSMAMLEALSEELETIASHSLRKTVSSLRSGAGGNGSGREAKIAVVGNLIVDIQAHYFHSSLVFCILAERCFRFVSMSLRVCFRSHGDFLSTLKDVSF